jgi:hypothetical protein
MGQKLTGLFRPLRRPTLAGVGEAFADGRFAPAQQVGQASGNPSAAKAHGEW